MSAPLAIAEVNRMSVADFVARFGDVAEHSPWVAENAVRARPFGDREAMIDAFVAAVDRADTVAQRALLNAHPDLAGKAAIAGTMAADSVREQSGAGLDRLTPEEFARFTEFNTRYRARHGIPFILAVKGVTKAMILAAFADRIDQPREAEFREALRQVARIIRFRIEDRVDAAG